MGFVQKTAERVTAAEDFGAPCKRAIKTLTNALKRFQEGEYGIAESLAEAAKMDVDDFMKKLDMASGKKLYKK